MAERIFQVIDGDRSQWELIDKNGYVHQLEYYDNPRELGDEIKQTLVTELTPLTGLGFMRSNLNSEELQQDVAEHVLRCDRLVVSRCGDRVSGFIAASVRQKDNCSIYHLEGVIVDPDFQGSGLASKLLGTELAATEVDYLAFHTQSRKMYNLGQRYAFLNYDDALEFGDVINSRNQCGCIDVGRYGNASLYEDTYSFSDVAINEIGWQNGDAMICVGPVKKDCL